MLRFVTASGTTYELDGHRVRRSTGVMSDEMRRDDDWLRYDNDPIVEVGRPVEFWLQPLGYGDVTIRVTTPVLRIEEDT